MKISDIVITAIIKKGVLYEARNVDMEIEIPMSALSTNNEQYINNVVVRFKADNMSLKIEKSES